MADKSRIREYIPEHPCVECGTYRSFSLHHIGSAPNHIHYYVCDRCGDEVDLSLVDVYGELESGEYPWWADGGEGE